MPGCQRGYLQLRCPVGSFRVFGEFPQTSRDLYDDAAYSDNDRHNRQDNG